MAKRGEGSTVENGYGFKEDIEKRILSAQGIYERRKNGEAIRQSIEMMAEFLLKKETSEELFDAIYGISCPAFLSIQEILEHKNRVKLEDDQKKLEMMIHNVLNSVHEYAEKILGLLKYKCISEDEENDSHVSKYETLFLEEKRRNVRHTTFGKKLALMLGICEAEGLQEDAQRVFRELEYWGLSKDMKNSRALGNIFLKQEEFSLEENSAYESVECFALALACAEKMKK